MVLAKGRRATEVGFSGGGGNSLRCIESPSDLPVAVTVPPESVPEELQLIKQAFLITQGSGPVHERG
jgi:hypothetical protein